MPHMGRSIHAARRNPKDRRRPARSGCRVAARLKPHVPEDRNRIVAKKSSQTEKRPIDRSRVKFVVAGAVLLACLGFAVPRMFEAPGVDPVVPRVAAVTAGPRPQLPTAARPAAATAPAKAANAPKPVVVEEAGDLDVSLTFRWPEFESGDRVLAKVRYTNHGKSAVYVPAAGEPNQTLAVAIEDSEGNEVRRIVEAGDGEALPRRLVRVDSGTTVDVPVTIVDENEKPLPPGAYTARVQMKADPRLARLGMPMWSAPHGPICSDAVPLVIKPAAAAPAVPDPAESHEVLSAPVLPAKK
jgi:hypothetical protein